MLHGSVTGIASRQFVTLAVPEHVTMHNAAERMEMVADIFFQQRR
jgi:hypothetical protein